MNVIEINELTKLYKNNCGIKDVNLEIKKGEVFGLIGPNGAGKSTTIRTILNLIHPTSGTIKILDMDSMSDSEKILNHVGYLPGELNYYDNLKAIDLLKYSEKFYKKNCKIRREFLAKVLEFDLNLKIDALSLGNKKKLGIIDALQHEPEILVLDEPTSGLDPLIQRKFFELLNEEKARGVTIIFSSHVLSEVQKICDRVAIIKEGKIIKLENINDIKTERVKNVILKTTTKKEIRMEGISGVKEIEDGYEFLYKGRIDTLVKMLNTFEIIDLMITEPNLEDVFIHYYE